MSKRKYYKTNDHIVGKRQLYRRIAETKNNFYKNNDITVSGTVQLEQEDISIQLSDNFINSSNVCNNLSSEIPESVVQQSSDDSSSYEDLLEYDISEDINFQVSEGNVEETQADTEPTPSSGDLLDKIRRWALHKSVPKSAVNDLLKILKPYHPELPTDFRTLLKTPTSFNTIMLNNGEYIHIGLQKHLEYFLSNYNFTGRYYN
ncbi:hypothetical protein PPYR_13954 [Photinus pyralis]|uniref:Uncharacterized protein n=1 Tax=Photinus pyralis TaxID=7054 RepID=A0A5N4A3U7_PHOPY|nr:hypothetical protein PPYR_13954 [Photinus pyralis]